MRRAILVIIILAAVASAAWYLSGHDDTDGSGPLTVYGNVDIREVALGFRVGGRVEAMLHEEGERVVAGETLARLDDEPYREGLDLAEAERDAARADLEKLESGSRDEEIRRAQAQVAEAETALESTRRVAARQSRLFEQGLVSEQVRDDAVAAQEAAAARLASARAQLELAQAGFRAEDVRAASARLRAVDARVAQAETALADTELTAPAHGTIITRITEPGAVVAVGQPVYRLSLDAPVWVRAYVAEPDLGRIHPGMPATVLTDSGGRYTGRVGFISPDAEFTPKSVQTESLRTDLVYRIRVVVEEPDQGLRRGMPVTVELGG